jgi:hypothetical protein
MISESVHFTAMAADSGFFFCGHFVCCVKIFVKKLCHNEQGLPAGRMRRVFKRKHLMPEIAQANHLRMFMTRNAASGDKAIRPEEKPWFLSRYEMVHLI